MLRLVESEKEEETAPRQKKFKKVRLVSGESPLDVQKSPSFPFNSLSRIEIQLGYHKMQYAPRCMNFSCKFDKKLKIKRDEKRNPLISSFERPFLESLFSSALSLLGVQPMSAFVRLSYLRTWSKPSKTSAAKILKGSLFSR